MVEETGNLNEMMLEGIPKMTFEELRQQVIKDPKNARKRIELL